VRDEIYQTFNAFAGKAVLVALSAHRSWKNVLFEPRGFKCGLMCLFFSLQDLYVPACRWAWSRRDI
jgi:hypothetical protein